MNITTLAGNIATDLEPRKLPGDAGTVLDVRLAVVTPRGRDEAEFIPFVVYGPQADNLARFNAKGSPIAVRCHVEINRWTDKDTQEARSKLVLVADQIDYLGPKR